MALGTVAGCMNDLVARGLLRKGKDGRRVDDRQALVALWVQAYIEGLRPKLKERRFQVRAEGKREIWPRLQKVFAERGQPWALTGADAAQRRMPFFRADYGSWGSRLESWERWSPNFSSMSGRTV